jgi:hypothetical protein
MQSPPLNYHQTTSITDPDGRCLNEVRLFFPLTVEIGESMRGNQEDEEGRGEEGEEGIDGIEERDPTYSIKEMLFGGYLDRFPPQAGHQPSACSGSSASASASISASARATIRGRAARLSCRHDDPCSNEALSLARFLSAQAS